MIIETIVWILFTLFIVWLSAVKTKHFMKERGFKKATKEYYEIRIKPTINKTMDEKKNYLRQKTETGQDIMTVVISMFVFILGFIVVVYSKITNFQTGLAVALATSLLFSWLFARLQFTKYIYEYKFIDAFVGYLFTSTFLVYIKFIEHPFTVLLLLLSIGLMIGTNKIINQWVGNKDISGGK